MMMKKLLLAGRASIFMAGCQTIDAGKSEAASLALVKAVYEFTKGDVDFEVAYADLNNDGIKDGIVLLEGANWCGSGGCTLLIFEGLENGEYRLASKSTVASAPIYVLEATTNGWSDLSVYTHGKGQVMMKWGGSNYPSNPSLQPTLIIDSQAVKPVIPQNIPN